MPQTTATAEPHAVAAPAGHYRWVIVALLFVITTINYMDRNLLGVLKPTIQGELHFSESEFGTSSSPSAWRMQPATPAWARSPTRWACGSAWPWRRMVWCLASAAHGLGRLGRRLHRRPHRARTG